MLGMFAGFQYLGSALLNMLLVVLIIHLILYWNSHNDLLSEWLEILHEATNDF